MGSNWVYAADKVAAPAEAKMGDTKSKPTGDVDKFWTSLNWDDLFADEKKLWGVLGWNGKVWDSETEPAPASEGTVWKKLSKEEQATTKSLGYDEKSWNKE